MPYQQKEVDGFRRIDGINEPLLLCQICGCDDPGVVRVALKIEQDTKCHDSQSEWGCEVAILLTNVLKFARGIVQYLHIRSYIFFAIVLAELCEGLVGSSGQVQLMVSNSKDVVV